MQSVIAFWLLFWAFGEQVAAVPWPKGYDPTAEELLQHERDCAQDLYQAACCVMRYQSHKDCWTNLENAAARWNAARQYCWNAKLRDGKKIAEQQAIQWQKPDAKNPLF